MNFPIVVKAYFGLMKELMVINIDSDINDDDEDGNDDDDDDDDDDDKYDKGM